MEQEIVLEGPTVVVRAFHEAMQARDWVRAADRLAPDLRVWWPATQEQFSGDRFLRNAAGIPESWRLEVVELLAKGPRVAGRIAVDHDGQRYWNHGWWTVVDGRITQAVELWGTEGADNPPEWRHAYTDAASPRRPVPDRQQLQVEAQDLFDDPKDRREAQVVSQMMEGLRGVVD